jgi:copper chaperone CopZ
MCLKECEAKHAEICGEHAQNHRLTAMSIKGMTCEGCETKISNALMAVEGVNKVIDVCSKAGFAVVCTAKDSKLTDETFIKTVSSTGFESEIIPAVAKTTTPAGATNTTEKSECSAHKKDGTK